MQLCSVRFQALTLMWQNTSPKKDLVGCLTKRHHYLFLSCDSLREGLQKSPTQPRHACVPRAPPVLLGFQIQARVCREPSRPGFHYACTSQCHVILRTCPRDAATLSQDIFEYLYICKHLASCIHILIYHTSFAYIHR